MFQNTISVEPSAETHKTSEERITQLSQLCLQGMLEEIKECVTTSHLKDSYLNLLKTNPNPINWAAKQNQVEVVAYLIESGIVENLLFIQDAFEIAAMYGCTEVTDYFCLKAPRNIIALTLSIIEDGSIFNMRSTNFQSSQRLQKHQKEMKEILKTYSDKENLEKDIKIQATDSQSLFTHKL